VTIWDCAGSGATIKLDQVVKRMSFKNGVPPQDQTTFWQGMTPLMIAVKHSQLEMVKQLIVTHKVSLPPKNRANKSALDLAQSSIKDPYVLTTMQKLLNRETTSTKVARNVEVKEIS
jgi:hypothetical protein